MKLAYILMAMALPALALEEVSVVFYEEGLTNSRVRHVETFISDGQGFYRVDIDVHDAPVYHYATNYICGVTDGDNLFSTFSEHNPTLFIRNTNYTGFCAQSAKDNQATSNGGYGRNGTLVSEDEAVYAGHYPPDHLGRSVTWVKEDGSTSWGYPKKISFHPTKDLCLVKMDRPIEVEPAKVFTSNELLLMPIDMPLIGVDRLNYVWTHRWTGYGMSVPHYYTDGDSGGGIFLKTGRSTYLVGKVTKPGKMEVVTQEDIELMREGL